MAGDGRAGDRHPFVGHPASRKRRARNRPKKGSRKVRRQDERDQSRHSQRRMGQTDRKADGVKTEGKRDPGAVRGVWGGGEPFKNMVLLWSNRGKLQGGQEENSRTD